MSEDVRRRQMVRAEELARTLTGGRPTRGIVRAMLALVVADEQPGRESGESSSPAPGAREVLMSKSRPALKSRPTHESPVAQEGLW